MKILKTLSLIFVLVITFASVVSAADIFSVKTSLNANPARKSCEISVTSGEVLEFSADDLELRLGLKPQSMSGITVTSLPKAEQGQLVLDGVDIDSFEFIDRENVDKLCFVPSETAVSANMTLIPRAAEGTTTDLAINVLAEQNLPPQIEGKSLTTMRNMPVSGYISSTDPENDGMNVRVITPPKNGTVRFDGLAFQYTPFKDVTGNDSFVICAIDSQSNFSKPATVSVEIEKPKNTFVYADMIGNPSNFAAIKLREKGVISGMQVGNKYFFAPNEMTTRGEFIVMLIAASGLDSTIKPTVNTGLPNDASIPSYLKPYIKKAIDADIWSETQAFEHEQFPSRAETVILVDRAAKIADVKDFTLTMSDVVGIPDWAMPSYKNLAAYKMLDLYDNMARPEEAITNSYSADLLWQLYKHLNR